MSKRPNIKSGAEKRVERQIQSARKARDRKNREKGRKVKTSKVPQPYILSVSRGPVDGGEPKRVREWIDGEAEQQMKHYRRISREIERLAPQRNQWVKEFFARITGPRGFSVHAGMRRTIPEKEIPKRPRRPWRLVW